MSIHLVTCASRVAGTGITPTHKLVLLCFAEDSRDVEERRASPGLEAAMRWSMLSVNRCREVIRDLVELELLTEVQRGHGTNRGQRKGKNSVFVVFPNGCCEAHGMEPGESDVPAEAPSRLTPAQLEARRKNVKTMNENRAAKRAGLTYPSDPDSPVDNTYPSDPDEKSASEGARSQHPTEGQVSIRRVGPLPKTYSQLPTPCEVSASLNSPGPWAPDPNFDPASLRNEDHNDTLGETA